MVDLNLQLSELVDVVGLDTLVHVANGVHENSGVEDEQLKELLFFQITSIWWWKTNG